MKWLLKLFSFLTVAAILGGFVLIGWGVQAYRADGPLAETTLFTVEKGQGVSAIATELEHTGVINNADLFKIMARVTDQHTGLKAGEYEFQAGVSIEQVLLKLEAGEVVSRNITIPEGLTSWQIVQILKAHEHLGAKELALEIPAEGHLLPETYSYQKGDTAQDILNRMNAALETTLDELWEARAENLPLKTKEDALILASIVEKETGVSGERAKVAGVFINRLNIGMALQTDPTVIYALTKGEVQDEGQGPLGRRLLKKDLVFDSPYNTYLYPGLPPTPIANAGRAAIEATLNPAEHDYIYFVADGTGGHAFGKTLAEHNANVAKWRKIRKAR